MAQRASKSERSRTLLIKAASEALIAGNGAFELQDVARRADVSVGLAYHRFGSKAGLIAAVVDHFYDEIDQTIDLADVHQTDWAVREQERLSRLIDFLYSTPLAAVIISKLARDPEVAVVEAERWNDLIASATRNIIKGQDRGQISRAHNPMILAALISGGVRHAVGHALAATPRPSKTELMQDIWNFITGGLQLNKRTAPALILKHGNP